MLAVFACRPEKQFLWVVAIPIRFYTPDSIMRLGSEKCLTVRRDEMIHYPTQALRLLTNIDKKPQWWKSCQNSVYFLYESFQHAIAVYASGTWSLVMLGTLNKEFLESLRTGRVMW